MTADLLREQIEAIRRKGMLEISESEVDALCDMAIASLAERERVIEACEGLVSLLLESTEPIGPMRSRKDYPIELENAIRALNVAPSDGSRPRLNPACVHIWFDSEYPFRRGR